MTRQPDTERHIIDREAPVIEALDKINRLSGDSMTLFVTDEQGRMLGTLTDGDIRRGLLAGHDLQTEVGSLMNKAFRCLTPSCDVFTTVRDARAGKIDLLPRLDTEGRLAGIVNLRCCKELLPVDAVLMAGGRGERLRPLTLTTPKPLLEIGGKAIIDYNVDELMANGVENIFVTVNYLKEQIVEHFNGCERYRDTVECVEETEKLGTMGSLSLVPRLENDDVIVMNSDLLTSISFGDLYARHREEGNALTMAVVPYSVSVPFAILDTDDAEGRVKGLQEKPVYNYLANAGVYIMRRDIARRIPRARYLDAPDFIESLISQGEKIGYFPIDGTWIDIGSPDDFRNAQKIMKGKNGRL